jgi:hypothetical protein
MVWQRPGTIAARAAVAASSGTYMGQRGARLGLVPLLRPRRSMVSQQQTCSILSKQPVQLKADSVVIFGPPAGGVCRDIGGGCRRGRS